MGSSSNGVSRGQLRPHFAGRGPPFIVAGLMVICCLLAFSYWNLSSRHSVLESQLSDTQARNQDATLKLQQVEKARNELSNQFQEAKEELEKLKVAFEKLQNQLNDLSQKLQGKDEELGKAAEETDALKSQLSKCSEEKDRNGKTVDDLKENIRSQIAQIHQLEETKEKMQNVINSFSKPQSAAAENNAAKDQLIPVPDNSNNVDLKKTPEVAIQKKSEEQEAVLDPNHQGPHGELSDKDGQ